MGAQGSRTPLTDTQKRLLLYGVPTVAVLLLLALIWFLGRLAAPGKDQDWTSIDYAAMPEVDLLRRYLRIDTSQATGSEVAGAEFLAAELRRMGLEPTVEVLADKHANVWAILEGENPEALVLHSHIDVYPIVEPETWTFDPFGATIDQAWLYGRGVFDMKSVTVVQLLALQRLVERGRPPKQSVIFLATGSEEVGSELGARWILDHHPELANRFEVVLTEGGIVEPIDREVIKYWGVEFGQKRFVDGVFCAQTKEQLEALIPTILGLNELQVAEVITDEVRLFANSYGPSRDNPLYRDALLDPDGLFRDANRFRQLPLYLRALFRNEIAPFEVESNPEGGFRMRFKIHLLPGQTLAGARERLLPEWFTHGLTVQLGEPMGAEHGSEVDHRAFVALAEAVKGVYPKATVGPLFLSWSATDSRFFRQRGINSYGFSPFVIFSTDSLRVDGPNERMSLPGYISGFEIYRDAVFRIAG
ncbi:MAG: M20 family metallopeptidase [Thermoanaerobaculia bacterium]